MIKSSRSIGGAPELADWHPLFYENSPDGTTQRNDLSLSKSKGVAHCVGLYAVAHTTSKIYRLDNAGWKLVYAAPDEDGDVGRYGLRCLAGDGDTVFVSDEVNGQVLMMSSGGRMAKFADGFDDPSGLEVRGDWLYVCDEGNGGRLWKVDKNGVKTLVADGLGRPRNVLFTDDKTALVSDRDGRVLKLNWEK